MKLSSQYNSKRRQKYNSDPKYKEVVLQRNQEWRSVNKDLYMKSTKKSKEKNKKLYRQIAILGQINQRCSNPKNRAFMNYGGRGIKAELTMKDIKRLWEDCQADDIQKPSLDRIDNDGNYTYENCRFIELKDNARKSHIENRIDMELKESLLNLIKVAKSKRKQTWLAGQLNVCRNTILSWYKNPNSIEEKSLKNVHCNNNIRSLVCRLSAVLGS